MKKMVCLIGVVALIAGCAPFQEAYYLDREFGNDSRAAWDAQIINQDQRYAEEVPDGMAGMTAEEIINIRTRTFAEKPTKSKIFEFDTPSSN